MNAKIKLDDGVIFSENYAQRCCYYAGIRSVSKRCKYTKPGQKYKIYPNLSLADMGINKPFEVVVSDMTGFWCQSTYYELTLYMDLFNNEIVSYGLSSRKGDRDTYLDELEALIEKKKEYKDLKIILHSDQGSVNSSKSFNELLPLYKITHLMSRAGTPTDNGAIESINGWIKEELFNDFRINESLIFINYLTPKQFKKVFTP